MSFKHLENLNTVTLIKLNPLDFVPPAHVTPAWMEQNLKHIRDCLIIDLETTGFYTETDAIIEIGLRKIKFDRRTGDFVEFGPTYSGLEDPHREIPKKITYLTGLDHSQLKDHQIDWDHVAELLETSDLIIAHNARFDRSFMDRKIPLSKNKIWACSSSQIDWLEKGFSSPKLELLEHFHGFYVDAHRAMNDVDGLTHLLKFSDPSTGKPYFHELLEKAKQKRVKISAAHSPIESKDLLKNRDYQWDRFARCWHKSLRSEETESETQWLEQSVYQGPFLGKIEPIRLIDHFKS